MSEVKFHHYSNSTNLGDLLCSPKHYFDFSTNLKEINIIGGGTHDGYLTGKISLPVNSVLWGIGSGAESVKVKDIDVLAMGFRDLGLAKTAENILPCVSCLHPMLDSERSGDNTVVFINADPTIVPAEALRKLYQMSSNLGFSVLTNRSSEVEFIETWKTSNNIITNSYHGAYWSLLAGKSVSILGHNFKFSSLLKSMNIDGKVLRYARGDVNEFFLLIGASLGGLNTVKLNNHRSTLEIFRDKQIKFAKHLLDNNIITSFKVLHSRAGSAVGGIEGSEAKRLEQLYHEVII